MKHLSLFIFLSCIAIGVFPAQNIRPKIFRKYPAQIDSVSGKIFLHNQKAPIGKKIGVACGYAFGYEAAIYSLLFAVPESISKWSPEKKRNWGNNFQNAFTKPMALDDDPWYINYVGHPYQGSIYYNSMRSQGAEVWQSALFSLGHSFLWEFTIEGALEQPSIQDMIVTPLVGSLMGELFHFAAMRMSRNGFTWYEKAFVCLFNPIFAIHNGFKFALPKRIILP